MLQVLLEISPVPTNYMAGVDVIPLSVSNRGKHVVSGPRRIIITFVVANVLSVQCVLPKGTVLAKKFMVFDATLKQREHSIMTHVEQR